MFSFNSISNVLNSLDNAAKENLEEPRESATSLRSKLKSKPSEDEFITGYEEDGSSVVEIERSLENINTFEQKNFSEHLENNVSLGSKVNEQIPVDKLEQDEVKVAQPEGPSSSQTTTVNRTLSFEQLERRSMEATPPNKQSVLSKTLSEPKFRPNKSAPGLDTSSAIAQNEHSALPKVSNKLPPETAELKKALKKKNQEIENLNRECLEFEEQIGSLKNEVREAWESYKQAQEKAAARETELLDELKEIKKAKLLDKQQATSQITRLNDDLSATAKRIQALSSEKEDALLRLSQMSETNASWEAKYSALQEDLQDAKASTIQGAQAMREELRQANVTMEQIRSEHSALARQSQLRQSELERQNAELIHSLTESQKEIERLQRKVSESDRGLSGIEESQEFVEMEQKVVRLSMDLENQTELFREKERLVHQLECEARANQLSLEEERKRHMEVVDELSSKVAKLQDKVKQSTLKRTDPQAQLLDEEAEGVDVSIDDYYRVLKELEEQKKQNQNLSQLLLKKQGVILELQAEKSALKSRMTELQNRCSQAESRLASLKDLEFDGGMFSPGEYDDIPNMEELKIHEYRQNAASSSGVGSISGSTSGLSNRRGLYSKTSSSGYASNNHRVISDLERFGVKPGTSVTNAVNMIDAWTLLTGRFLRSYPMARFGFVVYLLVLHLWVLVVLVIHTHNLDIAGDPRDQLNP